MSHVYAPAPVDFNSPGVSCDCLAHVYGNAADHPDRVRRYPSDMSDEEWTAVRPLLPTPAWLEGRGGQPEGYCHRQMLDQCHEVKCPLVVSRVVEMREGLLLSRGSTKIFLRRQRPSGPVCHGRQR